MNVGSKVGRKSVGGGKGVIYKGKGVVLKGDRRIELWVHVPRVEITMPRVTSDLLMLLPSFSLSPLVPADAARSLKTKKHNHIQTFR